MRNENSGTVHGSLVQAESIGTVNVTTAPSLPAALDGLPPVSGAFAGRLPELERLKAGRGLTLVHGLGGIGKTQLLLHYGHDSKADFPGGRLYIDLQGYNPNGRVEPTDALASLLWMLGRESPPGEAERAALFRTEMAAREGVLLLLDNASATDQVAPLLVAGHRVVVSSRNTLASLQAESLELGVLTPAEAVELVGDEEIAELCGRLPLALRIMASLIESEPDTDWAAELRDTRLDVLDDGDDNAVHKAFRLSYNALEPDRRSLFRLLSLHPGDIDPESTAALADLPIPKARRLLADLRAAHLLERGNRFHDLVRLYAGQCLVEAGVPDPDSAAALLRLVAYYPRAAAERAKSIQNHRCDPKALAWMDRNHPAVLVMAIFERDRGRNVVPVANAMFRYFSLRKHLAPWLRLQRMAVDSARKAGDRRSLATELNRLGTAHRQARRFEEAIALGEEALRINEEVGNRIGIGSTLITLSATYRNMGRPDLALPCCERSLRIRREIDDRYGLGITLTNLGDTHLALGDPDLAITHYLEALELQERLGYEGSVAITLHDLGKAHQAKGEPDLAVEHFLAALEVHRRRDDRFLAGVTLRDLGTTYRGLGRVAEAHEAYRDALAAFEEVDAKYDAHTVRDLITALTP
ncbi:tetratricopeptide repeat protein [Umezawaea tangerina]|uniref:Tetratricopeptide repeat protein n=1 Tax=Umezawaea tangerina TaxID=84725 RepID=A0A2T0T3U1_9PSEU|nr:tetratricopeptide repeat protein [Umezawaea tangerina]PRY40293.1 tetratricopeptide repeat protein [Umezawaea tangerina]